jgi:tape measure domain-containing protein
MASTQRIEIIITERGSRQVRRNIGAIGDRASASQRSVRLLNRTLQALATGAIVSGIFRLADSFTNLQNRLRVVTNGTAELGVVTDELFDIARRTRSSFEATAELYARTALATRNLGRSQQETLNFTESLNQAIILSGASAQEAENGLIQLSQGLASNRLSGDELRSTLEQLPVVTDVIAESIGVTRGELRELGAQGKISAEIILDAFRDAREELEIRFQETVPTLAQSFTVLENTVVRLLGSLNESTGIFSNLSRGILFLADNFEEFARIVASAGVTTLLVAGFNAATTAVNRFTAALALNPFGAIAVALTATISLLVAFSDRLTLNSESLTTLQDLGSATFERIGEGIEALTEFFSENFGFIGDFASETFGGINLSLEGVLRFTAEVLDAYLGLWIGIFRAIITGAELLPTALRAIATDAFNNVLEFLLNLPNLINRIGVQVFNGLVSIIQTGINQLITGVNFIFDQLGIAAIAAVELVETVIEGGTSTEEFGAAVGEAFRSGFDFQGLSQELDLLLDRAEDFTETRLGNAARDAEEARRARANLTTTGTNTIPDQNDRAFQELLDRLQQENALLTVNADIRQLAQGVIAAENTLRRELTSTERDLLRVELQTQQQLERRAEILDGLNAPQTNFLQGQRALDELLRDGLITLDQYNTALVDLEVQFINTFDAQGFGQNFRFTLRDMELATRDSLGRIGATFAEVFGPGGTVSRGFADTFANALLLDGQIDETTGKTISFRNEFRDGIQEISEAIVNQLISALVQVGINLVLTNTIGRLLGTSSLAATTADAAAAASAWATPAALASLATLGTNALAANAAVAGTIASTNALARIPGFQDGGFTGNVGRNDIAGFVHGREFVMNANATARNRPLLENLNRGGQLRAGGTVVNIQNNAPGVVFEQQQVSRDEIRIIARQAVREDAPNVVAADLNNPNSKISKSVNRNTTANRRR